MYNLKNLQIKYNLKRSNIRGQIVDVKTLKYNEKAKMYKYNKKSINF